MKKALLRLYLKSIYEQLTNSKTEIKKNLKEDALPCLNDLDNAIDSIFSLICTLEH